MTSQQVGIGKKRGKFLRLPHWMRYYRRPDLLPDVLAGLIVGLLVIPQSLGYALLSGLPPIYGLYSAIVPVLVYAWIGASSVNAVGPVAITALMTAQALQPYQHLPSQDYAILAGLLALLTGMLLFLASLLRLGWITQFISRGVNAGFVTAASLLILLSQVKFITGSSLSGATLPHFITTLWQTGWQLHGPTVLLGTGMIGLLLINRYFLKGGLKQLGVPAQIAQLIQRIMPLVLMIAVIGLSMALDFGHQGIRTLQQVPQGLPHLITLPLTVSALLTLLPSALLMALIAFVSSHAVASHFARQRRQPFDANRELLGLGLANIAGSCFQGFAVAGGFSRTALNVESGARSPLASLVSVAVMVVALYWLAGWLAPLPYAALAAMIIVSIISLIDTATLRQAWSSDRLDAYAYLVTLLGVLLLGLNMGLVLGLLCSFAGLIWQSSHPHMAIVGQVGDSGHFRNVARHPVRQHEGIVIIRIDENLFYGNAQSVRQFIDTALQQHDDCRQVILMCSAVNHIDLTAQEMLVELNQGLMQRYITLHYSEIKGPLMDILIKTPVITQLSGQVFLSTAQAVRNITQAQAAQQDYVI